MRIDYVGKCDIGSERKINQDLIAMFSTEEIGLFVVADGMGGHANGEKASLEIIQEMTRWWQHFSEKRYEYDFQRMLLSIEQAIEKANAIIYQHYNNGEVCGSTVIVLFIYKGKYGIVYAGDSRCYIFEHGQLLQITIDEVWENQTGLNYWEKNNRHHPNRGKLINAVGIRPDIQCKIITNEIISNSVFLLCSDGLHKMCPEQYIKKCLKKCKFKKNIKLVLDKLINKVYQNGAKDNISILLVRCYV